MESLWQIQPSNLIFAGKISTLDDLPIENGDLPQPDSPEGATIQLVDLEYQVAALISYVYIHM